MDQRLAELYGTNQVTEDDVEKLAAAELAEQLTEDGDIDLSGITEEDLEAVAQEVLGASGEEAGEEDEEEEVDGETQEKVATADLMGRVMAHAFVQEQTEIEKDAGAKEIWEGTKRFGRKVHGKITGLGARALNVGSKKGERRVGKWTRKAVADADVSASKKFNPSSKDYDVKKHEERSKAIADARKGAKKRMGRVVAGTGYGIAGGTATAAGYGAKKIHDKVTEKRASAIDTLALQRAEEMLAASQEETVTPYDVLADVVEQRAVEILQENGYEVGEAEQE
jgi:hypothetical protein